MSDQSGSHIAAFFDLDLTILGVNSARDWIRQERVRGHIGRMQLLEALFWLIAYRLGLASMESGLFRAIATLQGRREDITRERTHAWFQARITATILPKAVAAIEAHRAQGHRLVLLTSSSPYISEQVVATLGLEHALCTRFEVVDGIFTGQPILPLCYGTGKVHYAREWAEQAGVSLQESYFYTDSITDLPMLEAVGHPRVVNPDARLKRLAVRRGWWMERWFERESGLPPEGSSGPLSPS